MPSSIVTTVVEAWHSLALIFLTINLVVDLAYSVADPEIRYD